MTERAEADRRALPPVVYNVLSLVGGALASMSLGLILLLVVLELLSGESHPYMGIIAFVILPVFLLAGLALAAFGVVRQMRLRRRGGPSAPLPQLDFNDPRHRRAVLFVAVGSVVLAALSAFGSYQAYDYTDSNAFCGEVCHSVMHPEYTAYQTSPHARVKCVECHIGPGAEWFVRSKLSGAYQVYAVLFDRFPRPIRTPIASLRPSRDTCEQCHWPAAFLGQKFVVHDYYLRDEANTHTRLGLLVKTGGANPGAAPPSGIHWHMALENEVSYFASDDRRQQIPWVRVRTPEGTERIYVDVAAGFAKDDLDESEVREMDCLDCHNRPTHHFRAPAERLNRLLASGRIDAGLPSVKDVALVALEQPHATREEAETAIASAIRDFYGDTHPEVARQRAAAIEAAITEVQQVYRENYFPGMSVSWKAFPDNQGHLYAPGCFRCHDGKHVSSDGTVLSRDCQLCHTLVTQDGDNEEGPRTSLLGVGYQHPVDIGDAWKEMNCSDCHGG